MSEPMFSLHWIDYAIVACSISSASSRMASTSRGRWKGGADDYFLAGRIAALVPDRFLAFRFEHVGIELCRTDGRQLFQRRRDLQLRVDRRLRADHLRDLHSAHPIFSAKVATVPEFLEHRYDVRSRRAFSLFTILAIMFIDTAGALYAGGLVISNVTGFLNLWTAVAVLALVAGIYTILGGLSAVVVTDTVQAILLIMRRGGAVLARPRRGRRLVRSCSPASREEKTRTCSWPPTTISCPGRASGG